MSLIIISYTMYVLKMWILIVPLCLPLFYSPWSVMTLTGHSGEVRCLHLEDNRLVSGSVDTTIKVWDLDIQPSYSSIGCRVTMVGHTNTVRCVQMSLRHNIVISGSYDETLKIWCLKTGRCQETLRGHHGRVLCMYVPWKKHPGVILSGMVK